MDLDKTGIYISTLRKQSNMTQRELAEKIGVTDKAVSRWETGKGFPDVALLPSLAEALGTSISELVMGEKIELAQERVADITDRAAVDTRYTFDRPRRVPGSNRWLAILIRRSIALLVVGLVVFVFFAQIPLTRVRSINPQIMLTSDIRRDQVDKEAWDSLLGFMAYGSIGCWDGAAGDAWDSQKVDRLSFSTDTSIQLHEQLGGAFDLKATWTELSVNAFLWDKIHFVSRELTRGGERVTVIYFYPSQTLIKRFAEIMITDSIVNLTRLAYRAVGEDLKTVEVYYLPENLRRIGQRSDDWYDCARFNGILIWSGRI
jgi:transcriptional regulator with XRE-family HTH domain